MDGKHSQESADYSDQRLTEFPAVPNPSRILALNLQLNLLTSLPQLSKFSLLRTVDLSNNQLVDLSPLTVVKTLRELNCSGNRLVSLAFLASLPGLVILRAAHNRIATVTTKMPDSLLDCDLSHNEISTVEFLQFKFPGTLQRLDISSNLITTVVELRYVSVFFNLLVLTTGHLAKHPDLEILAFVKYLCPSLTLFDGVDCRDVVEPPDFPRSGDLYDCVVRGSDDDLCQLLARKEARIEWSLPTFVPFREVAEETGDLTELAAMVDDIEARLARVQEPPPANAIPAPNPLEVEKMRQEIIEMKQQVADLVKLLYVHDAAVRQAFLRQSG
jgi:hypothetical protein